MLQPPRLASLIAVLLACALTLWPGPLADGAIGHPTGDLADHYWGAWWISESLLSGELPLRTEITHLPEGGALWHIDPLGGLLALLLRPLGFPLAWNTLLCLQVLAAALVARAAGVSFTGSQDGSQEGCQAGGAAAGVLIGGSPYVLGLLHSGLSEYLGLVWPTLFVWTLLGAMKTGRRAWLPALALFACTAQAFYYAAFAVLLAACMLPGAAWRQRLAVLLRCLALWALGALPWMAVAYSTLSAPDPAFAASDAPGWSFQSLPATDLMSWLRPGAWYHPDTPAMGNPGILHVNYVGWVALGLAALGAWRHPAGRELAPRAALFGALSLGPVLSWDRLPLRIGGVLILLPLALAYAPGSPFRFVHHPYRIVALLLPLLALLVAAGVASLPRWSRALAPALLLTEALWLSPGPWPVPLTPLPDPAPYAALRATGDPSEGAVLDWPPDASTWNRRYLMAQVAHGRPIAAGVNHFLSESLRTDPLVNALLRALDDPQRRAANRDVPARGPALRPPRPGPSQLGAMGFSDVVLHHEALSARELPRARSLLEGQLGPPYAEGDGWSVFGVDPRR